MIITIVGVLKEYFYDD